MFCSSADHIIFKTANIAKLVAKDWREQTPEVRAVWDDKAKKDKERYQLEMSKYSAGATKQTQPSEDRKLPKRPMSAYLAYSNKRRAALKRMYPEASNGDLSKMLSKAWKEAPPDVKAEYIEEEARLRAQYNIDMIPLRGKQPRKKRQSKAKKALKKQKGKPNPTLGTSTSNVPFDIESMPNLAVGILGAEKINPEVQKLQQQLLLQQQQQQQQQLQQQQMFLLQQRAQQNLSGMMPSHLFPQADNNNNSNMQGGGLGGGNESGLSQQPADQLQQLMQQHSQGAQAGMFGMNSQFAPPTDLQLLQQLQAAQQQQQYQQQQQNQQQYQVGPGMGNGDALQLQYQQLLNQQLQLGGGQVDIGNSSQHQPSLDNPGSAAGGGHPGQQQQQQQLQDLQLLLRQDQRSSLDSASAAGHLDAELLERLARGGQGY